MGDGAGGGGQTPGNRGARGSVKMVGTLETADGIHCKTLLMEQALWQQLTTGTELGLKDMKCTVVKCVLAEITLPRIRADTSTLRDSSDQEGAKLI